MIRLLLLITVSIVAVQGKCSGKCEVPITHYEEIGCEAVFAKPDDCCPSHFNCSKFNAQDSDKCYFKGKVYNKGDKIEEDLTEKHCAASCHCTKGPWRDIECANIECPEALGNPIFIGPGCFKKERINGCCSYKAVCPPFDKLAKCEVNGKTYYEGQGIPVPPGKEQELTCVCQPNFKGKLEEPFCRKISCGIELRDSKIFRKKCAPIYIENQKKCPDEWECPKDKETIVPNKDGKKSDNKCYYGKLELNIGDELKLNSPHRIINCHCRIPPLVTCLEKPFNPSLIFGATPPPIPIYPLPT